MEKIETWDQSERPAVLNPLSEEMLWHGRDGQIYLMRGDWFVFLQKVVFISYKSMKAANSEVRICSNGNHCSIHFSFLFALTIPLVYNKVTALSNVVTLWSKGCNA